MGRDTNVHSLSNSLKTHTCTRTCYQAAVSPAYSHFLWQIVYSKARYTQIKNMSEFDAGHDTSVNIITGQLEQL